MATSSLPDELIPTTAMLPQREATSGGRLQRGSSVGALPAVWLDLTLLNRTALTQVLERYALPLEVSTYFQLKFQSPKVIAVDRALFVVMFIATPSPRQVFVLHELKFCITPTLVAGLCERAARALPQVAATFAHPATLSTSVTQCVWDMLDEVLAAYEMVVATIPTQVLTRKSTTGQRWWRQRVAVLAEVLQQHWICLRNVVAAGRKIGLNDCAAGCERRKARIDQMVRMIDDAIMKNTTAS